MATAVPVVEGSPSASSSSPIKECIICMDIEAEGSALVSKSSEFKCHCVNTFFHEKCYLLYLEKNPFSGCPTCRQSAISLADIVQHTRGHLCSVDFIYWVCSLLASAAVMYFLMTGLTEVTENPVEWYTVVVASWALFTNVFFVTKIALSLAIIIIRNYNYWLEIQEALSHYIIRIPSTFLHLVENIGIIAVLFVDDVNGNLMIGLTISVIVYFFDICRKLLC